MNHDFESIGIKQEFIELLKKEGITVPTPVQSKAIPEISRGKDVVVEAQTGTGKTLAFLLPILERIKTNIDCIQALIISPTRELALQITNEINKFEPVLNINSLAVYGGQDVERQIRKLKGNVHIVVGTPGRLLDHIKRKTVNFQNISMLVIDEADQMLHMGFLDEVDEVIKHTSHMRQTMLFSATIPKGIRTITLKHMKSPLTIRMMGKAVTLSEIEQIALETPKDLKKDVLFKLIDDYNPFMAIIFCMSKRRAQQLNEELIMRGYSSDEIHGDLTQNKRESVMKKFRETKLQFLVATDIAGRGLDIEGVTHVFNYDIPRDAETYIHRIGRTGRAGETGIAVTLCELDEKKYLVNIEQDINKKLERKVVKLAERYDDEGKVIKYIDIVNVKNKDENKQVRKSKEPSAKAKTYENKRSVKGATSKEIRSKGRKKR
jgi:ATP-dependent RNA helicase DeaD